MDIPGSRRKRLTRVTKSAVAPVSAARPGKRTGVLAAKDVARARGVLQHPYAAVVVIPAGTVSGIWTNALVNIEVLTYNRAANVKGHH